VEAEHGLAVEEVARAFHKKGHYLAYDLLEVEDETKSLVGIDGPGERSCEEPVYPGGGGGGAPEDEDIRYDESSIELPGVFQDEAPRGEEVDVEPLM